MTVSLLTAKDLLSRAASADELRHAAALKNALEHRSHELTIAEYEALDRICEALCRAVRGSAEAYIDIAAYALAAMETKRQADAVRPEIKVEMPTRPIPNQLPGVPVAIIGDK